jgi:hypothetical protein
LGLWLPRRQQLLSWDYFLRARDQPTTKRQGVAGKRRGTFLHLRVMFKAIVAFALGFILSLCACSHHKILAAAELRSEWISAKWLVAETDMFLDYVRQSRATKYYAEGPR